MKRADHLRVVDPDTTPPPPAPVDPLLGTTIDGRYSIEGVLGEGGMGLVYRAKHAVLGKSLAMKVLRSDVSRDEEIITRFRLEAQSASAIGNQHIIDVSDFGTLPDGSTYFVMEHLDGRDLTAVIEEESPVQPPRVLHIAKQLCRALGAAHANGIVHRDMKPDNVYLIVRGGDPEFVKVLDFGIAKVGGSGSKLTKNGQVFGTPHYMSPEQCAGRDVDHRTDIYALGVIMYEMACGKCPFDAENLMGILTKHLYEEPVPPSEKVRGVTVPPALEAVIQKCLVKERDDRYQSMDEVYEDLERVQQGEVPIAAGSTIGRLRTARARLRSLAIAAAIVLLSSVVGFLVVSSNEDDPDPIVDDGFQHPPASHNPPEESVPRVTEATPLVGEAEPADEVAHVRIDSIPSGAEVWRGGELIGNTPVTVPRPTGDESYGFEVRLAGYVPWPAVVSTLTQSEVTYRLQAIESENRGDRRSADRTPSPPSNPVQPTPPPRAATERPVHIPGTTEILDPWHEEE